MTIPKNQRNDLRIDPLEICFTKYRVFALLLGLFFLNHIFIAIIVSVTDFQPLSSLSVFRNQSHETHLHNQSQHGMLPSYLHHYIIVVAEFLHFRFVINRHFITIWRKHIVRRELVIIIFVRVNLMNMHFLNLFVFG